MAFLFSLSFITENSLVLSQWADLCLWLVFLFSQVMWSKRYCFLPSLILTGSTTIYRCAVVIIERKKLLLPYVFSPNRPQMWRCMVISSGLSTSLLFVTTLASGLYVQYMCAKDLWHQNWRFLFVPKLQTVCPFFWFWQHISLPVLL